MPNEILRNEHFGNDLDEKEQYVNFVLAICENIQSKIDTNESIFNKRSKNNQLALYLLCFIPLSPILAFLFSLF